MSVPIALTALLSRPQSRRGPADRSRGDERGPRRGKQSERKRMASTPQCLLKSDCSKMVFALFVWSIRPPSQLPDWNPVIVTHGAFEMCNIELALRHFGLIVSTRYFNGIPPNIASFADLVVLQEPIHDASKKPTAVAGVDANIHVGLVFFD